MYQSHLHPLSSLHSCNLGLFGLLYSRMELRHCCSVPEMQAVVKKQRCVIGVEKESFNLRFY